MLVKMTTIGLAVATMSGITTAQAALTQNALTQNALTQNALTQNALTQNGAAASTARKIRIVGVELPGPTR